MLVSSIVFSQMRSSANQTSNDETAIQGSQTTDQIEPNAGNWRTWVISSGEDSRVPPPPDPAETSAELRSLEDLIGYNDAQIKQQITF